MTLYCSKCGKNIGARLHDSTGQETCASCDDRAVAARTVRESTTTGNSCLGTALGVLAATVGLVALLCMAGCRYAQVISLDVPPLPTERMLYGKGKTVATATVELGKVIMTETVSVRETADAQFLEEVIHVWETSDARRTPLQ